MTARCPGKHWRRSEGSRSPSTCTSPSARRGADTATSTPTRRRSSGVVAPEPATWTPPSRRFDSRAACSAITTCRCTRSSSAAAPPLCYRPTSWAAWSVLLRNHSAWCQGPRSRPRPIPSRSTRTLCTVRGRRVSPVSRSACRAHASTCSGSLIGGTVSDAPEQCVEEARVAGFEHINVDLIYGTPGETLGDWQASLDAAVGAGPDHVSAYALIVEDGTRLAARVRRGELAVPDDDVVADRYLQAEDTLAAAGFAWYEVSNWARSPGARCRHNVSYWRSGDWWGIGPGAHSHVAGTRWWNVKHPSAYARRLAQGVSPAAGRETLSAEDRRIERVLLGVRLVEGHPFGRPP